MQINKSGNSSLRNPAASIPIPQYARRADKYARQVQEPENSRTRTFDPVRIYRLHGRRLNPWAGSRAQNQLEDLDPVFEQIIRAELKLKRSRCKSFREVLQFLGDIFSWKSPGALRHDRFVKELVTHMTPLHVA